MGCNHYFGRNFSRPHGLASLIFACVMIGSLLKVSCQPLDYKGNRDIACDVVDCLNTKNVAIVRPSFTALQERISISENPLQEMKDFLNFFLIQLNKEKSTNLSLKDLSIALNEDFHNLNLSPQQLNTLIHLIGLLEESNPKEMGVTLNSRSCIGHLVQEKKKKTLFRKTARSILQVQQLTFLGNLLRPH